MGVRRRTVALWVVLAGALAACGSQVDRSVFDLSSGQNGQFQSDDGGIVTDDGSVTDDGGAGDDGGATDGSTDGGSTDGGSTDGGSTDGGGGPKTGGKANYASDVGVTASSIKIGSIATIGGPMPGQFEPWLLGVRAWVNQVNERGGINGRKVQLIPCDDGMDAERNRSCARNLIENQKVFAIVGTNTPAMPSAQYVNDKKVPAVGIAPIGNYAWQLPYWFAYNGMRSCPRNGVTEPGKPGYCATNTIRSSNATYKYFKDTVGVKKAAVFWHNIDISKQAGLDFAHILEETGIDVVYTAETQVAEPDYTGHVLKMKDRGVEGIWEAMEINNNIRLLQAMDRQGFLPKAKVSTVSSFGQEIGKQVTGPSRNSLFAISITRPYTLTSNRAIGTFVNLFDRYFPGKTKHIWNVEGYRGGLLFGDAAAALGADLTREGMVQWLEALKDYDPHGLGLPFDFRYYSAAIRNAPRPPQDDICFIAAKYRNTDWFLAPGPEIKCPAGAVWVSPRGS